MNRDFYMRVPEEEHDSCTGCIAFGDHYLCDKLIDRQYYQCANTIFKLGPKKPDSKSDNVNHPAHYTKGKIEVIDFLEDQDLDFRLANVIKYITRYRDKNGLEDLRKAQWYLNRVITQMEKQDGTSSILST